MPNKQDDSQLTAPINPLSKTFGLSKTRPSISDNRHEHHKITKQKLGKALRDNLLRRKISEDK